MQKRVLAFLMVLAMVFSLLPVSLVGAEVENATPAFALTVQKAYNQTEGSLALDLYLQGTTDAQVTGYQFKVTPAEGLSVTGAVDATGNDGLAGSDTTFVYTPGATPLVVGTSRVLVATITLSGETLPTQAADAVTVADVTVTTADASYAVTDITSKTDNGAWADVTGKWQPLTKADLVASSYKLATGNYYLVEDIADTNKIKVSDENAKVNLCLNGYTYTSPKTDKLLDITGKAAVVKISDCTATGEGEDLVAGKFVLTYANWGNLRVSVADVKLYASNIILEGAEDAVFSSETNSNVGNAATFYQGSDATNSLIHAEDVLIRNVNSGKTVIDTRGDGYYKNVTFVNCSGGQNNETDSLGIFATNGNPKKPGTLTIDGCKFIDCEGPVLDTQNRTDMKFVLKGDVWADGEFFINSTCKLNLELGKNAKVNIATANDRTPETFGTNVVVPEGATLTTGTVMYKNVGSFVSYKDGVFYFDSHAHDEIGFKAWNDSSSLPSEGNYYLACDVTLTAETNITYGHELNLDLNGHTITTNTQKIRAFWVDGVLNLYDCAEQYDEDGNWIGGKITGFNNTTGGAIRIGRSKAGKLTDADRPTFNMYGGRLEDNGNTGSGTSGGAVYITSSRNTKDGAADERGGLFNMYGGELYNNHTMTLGGAVTVWGLDATRSGDNKDGERSAIADGLGATFNLYGGKLHGNVCGNALDTSSGHGGAIHVYQDAILNIYGGEIVENSALRGGAIHADGTRATINIEDGYFVGNSAADNKATSVNRHGSGGAIYVTGVKNVEIVDTYFHSNSAYRKNAGNDYAGLGGAIYSESSDVNITRCEIVSNESNRHGGALVSRGDNGTMYVKDSIISSNYAGGVGGAIYFLGANNTVTFDGTSVTGNETKTSGAVYVTSVTSRLVVAGKTVIAGNTRTNGNNNQQDVFFQAQASRTNMIEVNELTDGAHINMYHYHKDCVVNKNDTADGFVRLSDDGGTQTSWNCGYMTVYTGTGATNGRNVSYMDTNADGKKEFVFGHFHTDANGNLIEYTGISALPSADQITAAKEASADGVARFYLTGDVERTAQYVVPASFTLCLNGHDIISSTRVIGLTKDNTFVLTIDDCTAAYGLNGDYVAGGLTSTATTTSFGTGLRIQRGEVIMNAGKIYGITYNGTGSTGGTAVYIPGQTTSNGVVTSEGTGKFTMNGGEISDIHVTSSQAGVHVGHVQAMGTGTITLKNGAIRNNSITSSADSYVASGKTSVSEVGVQGVAIYRSGTGAMNIENFLFENNVATSTGNGLSNAVSVMYDNGATGTVTLKDVVVSHNVSETRGAKKTHAAGEGGLTAASTVTPMARGAIYLNMTHTVTMTNVDFIGNEAISATDARGAAIFCYSGTGNVTLNATNCDFTGNSATNYAGATYLANGTRATFTGCYFEGNESKNGGVAYSANSALNATFSNCEFVANNAQIGGALFMQYYNALTIKGCTFDGNEVTGTGSSNGRGGALNIQGNADKVATIGGAGDEGNTFVNNKSTMAGGAIYFAKDATSTITNCIFTGNTSGGGTIYYTGGGASTIDGCTFTENVSTGPVSAIRVEGTKTVTLKDSSITGNVAKSHGAVFAATGSVHLSLVGKVVITGNTDNAFPNNESTDLFFQNREESDGTLNNTFVDASGLTEGSSIGLFTYNARVAMDPALTTGGSAAVKDYFFSNNEDVYLLHTITVDDAEELALVKYIDEAGVGYATVQAALEAAEAAGKTAFKLQTNANEELTLTTIDYIDLDGKNAQKIIVPEGKTLTLVDSATNDYDVDDEDGYGKAVVQGSFKTYVEDTTSGSLKRYVTVTHSTTEATEEAPATATISAHRIYLAITAKTLRPTSNGVGFKAIFAGDQVVSENVAYGLELTGKKDFSEVYTAKFFNLENGVGNGAPNQKSVVIYEAITADDTSRWDADLYGRPFMTVGDQTIYGAEVTVNMKAMAANALKSGDQTIIDAVNAMMTECGVSAN